MARQRMHNRRAGRGATSTGASWISYSDMMAALVLIFVLILCLSLHSYMTMLEEKSQELETQLPGLFAIGDGAGITRGLAQAGASGVQAARAIAARIG